MHSQGGVRQSIHLAYAAISLSQLRLAREHRKSGSTGGYPPAPASECWHGWPTRAAEKARVEPRPTEEVNAERLGVSWQPTPDMPTRGSPAL